VAEVLLNDEQQDLVRRYVAVWRRWRQGIRGFANLEDHMTMRYEVLVDGIAVDSRPGHPVIAGDAKDGAIPDMSADELKQARRYILHGQGGMPVRRWRELKLVPPVRITDRHDEPPPTLPPAA
jgi:hypothetical protein